MQESHNKILTILRKAEVWPWFLAAAIFLVAGIIIVRQKIDKSQIISERDNYQKALTDTVKVFRMADGSQRATITAFQSKSRKDLLKIRTSDSTIQRLQELVSAYGNKISSGTMTTFTASTNAIAKTKTIITIGIGDTINIHDTLFIFPTYSSKFSLGKWIQGNTLANRDSTIVNLRTYNEYDVVVGESKGLFKRHEVYADVITHSPYDSINRLRAFKVSVPPQKRLGLGLSGGYGINALGGTMIYLGVGINYNLVNIK